MAGLESRRVPLRLVSLDLDGTLIHPAIFNVVAEGLGFGAPLQESYQMYLDGRMSLEEAFHHDYKFFVGREIEAMEATLAASAEWTPGIADAVARLKAAGVETILTTDQPRFLAQSVRRFGITDLVCTEATIRHGRATAEITPEFEKWPNLERYLAAKGIAPREVVHVGNGTNDIPVFERVGGAIAVNALSPNVIEAADASIDKLDDLGDVADIALSWKAKLPRESRA